MPKTIFPINLSKPMAEQELVGHNRWHPEVPPVVSVNPGDVFRVECKDWTDGQIKNNDSPDDVRDVELSIVHVLSGPIHVNGAKPGDILVVDILDIGCLAGDEWGFTGIFARNNGGGFLTDHYPDAAKAIWDLRGIYATSRHIPGVRFAGLTHPGLIGCAPSHELLAKWNTREAELVATNPNRVPPLAKGFDHMFTDAGDPSSWEKRFAISYVGEREFEGRQDIELRMVQRVRGMIDHETALVDPNTWAIDSLRYDYYNGGHITMTQTFREVGGYSVLTEQHAEVAIPYARAVINGSYTDYKTNVAIDDTVFTKKK